MDIWETNKLLLFIVFVVPGFVSLKAYGLLFSRAEKDSSQQLIDAVAYSSINYALLAWPVFSIENSGLRDSSPGLYAAFYFFVLLVAPIAWPCALWKLRKTQFFQKTLPHPVGKPWDYVFSKRERHWVIVTLGDGKQAAGRFDSNSFASSSPEREQIYLEEAWVLNEDGGFERPRTDSAGIMILASNIASVEFFHMTEGAANVEQETDKRGLPATAEGLSAGATDGAHG